jgi:hypothetical protein
MQTATKRSGLALRLIKTVLALLSVISLAVWGREVGLPVFEYFRAGGHLRFGYSYFVVFPFFYLAFCLISCTSILRRRSLVATGVIIHIGLVAWIIIHVSQPSLNTWQIAVLGIVFAGLWAFLCIARLRNETRS